MIFRTFVPVMRLLLRLWLTQKRRDFKWGKFLGEAYFLFLFMVISVTVTVVIHTEMGDATGMEKVVTGPSPSCCCPSVWCFLNGQY